jgi:hypothetical protein
MGYSIGYQGNLRPALFVKHDGGVTFPKILIVKPFFFTVHLYKYVKFPGVSIYLFHGNIFSISIYVIVFGGPAGGFPGGRLPAASRLRFRFRNGIAENRG